MSVDFLRSLPVTVEHSKRTVSDEELAATKRVIDEAFDAVIRYELEHFGHVRTNEEVGSR